MRVQIDGVTYVPEGAVAPSFGVSITTHNRPDLLGKALEAWSDNCPEGTPIVVVDDASTPPAIVPDGVTLVRFDENVGVARAKNAGIAALYDLGVQHLVLSDDDSWPVSPEWFAPYVSSGEGMLQHTWGDVVFTSGDLVGYSWPKGCILYLTREAVETVGGMDATYGTMHEHVDLAQRVHNAGLTTARFGDVKGSDKLFYAADRKGTVKSSIPDRVRRASNPQRVFERRHSTEFLPFRETRAAAPRPQIALSVLVPSVHTRWDTFAPKIQEQLFTQYGALSETDRARVEILMLTDTKSMTLGEKRNRMMELAQGEYVAFVDDDDRLEPTYLAELLGGIESGADVVTFHVNVSVDGGGPKLCRYSIDYRQDVNTATEYHRLPNHIMCVRRDLASLVKFPPQLCGEDKEYAKVLHRVLRTEHKLEKILYHYDYSRVTTETQMVDKYQHRLVTAAKPPTVDVVILSKGDTPELRAMCQHTIDTAIAGAGEHVLNVVVIESIPGVRYRDATTLLNDGEFAFNRRLNDGAKTGRAPWILFANSDLEFEDGWLTPLLAARHDLVSPLNPGDQRQVGISKNETGVVNGRHLSGWAFLMARKLWEKIDGLDEDFVYWCADDAVIEQARAVGVQPMLVPASRVKHLTSQTGSNPPDEWTWGMVALFNRKFGLNKFADDRRYIAWKRRNNVQ